MSVPATSSSLSTKGPSAEVVSSQRLEDSPICEGRFAMILEETQNEYHDAEAMHLPM
jgi:hypothetical protein